ncbi:flagellar biosynthetic protein FliO [Natranaerobius thermophilus]|uniref:Flagellar protein n=1 Tax=Natranaerobius thermophilus (strain ATCC BAA-1301 / DSM 18059 / JW/NM-WN-LF) TaxID=457570 RepID=B2A361_NATTJ|nr:flagellar biosynthetic protein FliO [Natranaerobius thermophilus]ACB84991.1 hypothetical protein Nther_1408 [Natranaerobius thermophilus JW/NM-WN-LF]
MSYQVIYKIAALLSADKLDEVDSGMESGTGEYIDYLMSLFGYLFVFLLVIGLLFVVLKLLKNYSAKLNESHHMRVLDSLPLDNEKKLILVEVGNKILLIGAGKELNLLTSVELSQEELQLIRESGKSSQSITFMDIWEKIKDKLPGNIYGDQGKTFNEDDESFEQQLQEELNKMRRSKDEGGHDDGER